MQGGTFDHIGCHSSLPGLMGQEKAANARRYLKIFVGIYVFFSQLYMRRYTTCDSIYVERARERRNSPRGDG